MELIRNFSRKHLISDEDQMCQISNQEFSLIENIYAKIFDLLNNVNDCESYYYEEKRSFLMELSKSISELSVYCRSSDVFHSQNIMIKIGMLIVENFDNFCKSNKSLAYNLLEIILLREEFSLNTMTISFNDENENKIKIGIRFLEFIYTLLIYSLKIFAREFIDSKTKVFISKILAISYLIIPDVIFTNSHIFI